MWNNKTYSLLIINNIQYLKQNIPAGEKERPSTNSLVENMRNQNEQPMPPAVDRDNKGFGHDDLTAKHHYFSCSRPPDVDGI